MVSEQRHFPCRVEAVFNGVARGEGLTLAQAVCTLVKHFWDKIRHLHHDLLVW